MTGHMEPSVSSRYKELTGATSYFCVFFSFLEAIPQGQETLSDPKCHGAPSKNESNQATQMVVFCLTFDMHKHTFFLV